MPTALLLTMLGVTIVLIAVVITVRGVLLSRAGKLLAFISLFVFPGAAVFFGTTEHMERSKQTSFCLSCHIMEPYGKSLMLDDQSHIPAAHFENSRIPRDHACYTCHTNYTIYGTAHDKFRGLRHAYKYYISHPSNPIKLYEPFNNRECLHCHSGARSFEEQAAHSDPDTMKQIKSNEISCLTCHTTVHDADKVDQLKSWRRPTQ